MGGTRIVEPDGRTSEVTGAAGLRFILTCDRFGENNHDTSDSIGFFGHRSSDVCGSLVCMVFVDSFVPGKKWVF